MDYPIIKISVPADDRTSNSRSAKRWKTVDMSWGDFVQRCSHTVRTSETIAEYFAWKKNNRSKAADAKDIGGFFGGTLKGEDRRLDQIDGRTMLTLDIDETNGMGVSAQDIWQRLISSYNVTALFYTTHTHTPEVPRLRIVIPTDRAMLVDEYRAVARIVASKIGMEFMDPTAFSPEHFMFWPSTAADGEFLFDSNSGALLNVDEVLSSLDDWHDVSQWPKCPKELQRQPSLRETPSLPSVNGKPIAYDTDINPLQLHGLVGDFCRAYTVEDAIDLFLTNIYNGKTIINNGTDETARYTYINGSSNLGLVCYNHLWAVSNHASDVATGKRVNAFDIVRIHLFGHLDKGTKATNYTRLPSYRAMCERIANDKRIKQMKLGTDPEQSWMVDLVFDKQGKIESSASNVLSIFRLDPKLKDKIWYDQFDDSIHCDTMPWHKSVRISDTWVDSDDVQLRMYFDIHFNLRCCRLIDDGMVTTASVNTRHAIRDYIEKLPEWDGVPRIDTLFIDYIGAEDTPLNRAMTRKWLVAAVKRVYEPGCKFDYCLVTAGKQGIGKSSVFEILGGKYHNGGISKIEGKEGREGLQGNWIIEFGELSALKHSEVETIKAYITDRADKYRAPYGRRVVPHPRQCVFCATTNAETFLKDETGNRRFWIIPVDETLRKADFVDYKKSLTEVRDMIWAEAYHYYKTGELVFLDADMEKSLQLVQENFSDRRDDDIADRLQCYLDRNIPTSWGSMSLADRRMYYGNPPSDSDTRMQVRMIFTVREFLAEYMGYSQDRTDRYLARRINALMRDNDDWAEISKPSISTGWAGQQRGFRRIVKPDIEVIDTS